MTRMPDLGALKLLFVEMKAAWFFLSNFDDWGVLEDLRIMEPTSEVLMEEVMDSSVMVEEDIS